MSCEREDVMNALRAVTEPIKGLDIVEAGLVRALTIKGADVRFVLEIDPVHAPKMEPVRVAAEQAVRNLSGVSRVTAVMTAHAAPAKPPDLKPRHANKARPQKLPGVDRLIAVASGKGGVGKSTFSSNLAVALATEGRKVGLLDADVYGPSQPRILGISGRPASPDGKTILPLSSHGVIMMSLGLLANEAEAVMWRGPMLMGALQQMLTKVQWGTLDTLLVDLPPGTGDVQMTLCQKFDVAGAIVVCTPQDIALLDARKGIDAFAKMDVPLIGLVENMSTYICPACGHEEHLFGHGGVSAEAKRIGTPLLAELPLDIGLRLSADRGTPITVAEPQSDMAKRFRSLAKRLIADGNA